MDKIKVHDKIFEKSITDDKIAQRVREIALKINEDFKYANPIFMAVLNGSFMFFSDLMKEISVECELHFVKMKSYDGMHSTAKVKTLIGPAQTVRGRSVVIIEDIVDTGNTITELVNQLNAFQPNDVKICTLLYKPSKYKGTLPIDYVAFDVPDDFVVGYGLDYDGLGRNFKDIYTVVE